MSTIHTIREDGQETVQRFPKYKPLIPIREVDGVVYVSGHGPENINTYEPLYRGRVGADLTLEEGYAAAAECAKTLLRAVQERYGSLDCIHHMVRALALVNCGEDFTLKYNVGASGVSAGGEAKVLSLLYTDAAVFKERSIRRYR